MDTHAHAQAHTLLVKKALASLEDRARQPGILLKNFAVAANWFRLKLAEYEHQVFAAAWLDNQLRLITFSELFRGTLTHTTVPVREVVKDALKHNPAAVLFAHNRPSGSPITSADDIALTIDLDRALTMVDVRVLDHFIIPAAGKPQSIWTAELSESRRMSRAGAVARAAQKTDRKRPSAAKQKARSNLTLKRRSV